MVTIVYFVTVDVQGVQRQCYSLIKSAGIRIGPKFTDAIGKLYFLLLPHHEGVATSWRAMHLEFDLHNFPV